jgi:hypothetical protein
MTLQPPTRNATPIFCEQFAAFLKIRTYISFKEGDERKEVLVGQILQMDLGSTVLISIFKLFEDIVLKKDCLMGSLGGHWDLERFPNRVTLIGGTCSFVEVKHVERPRHQCCFIFLVVGEINQVCWALHL